MKPACCASRRSMRALLVRMYRAAVAAASEFPGLSDLLPEPLGGRTALLAVGKAAVPTARSLLVACRKRGHKVSGGLVVVPYGNGRQCGPLAVLEASHPVPDAASVCAGREALALANSLGKGDLLLAAMSGGGSALLCMPATGLDLRTKQSANRALLRSGLDIEQVNIVRTHLSGIKGGRLSQAALPARTITYVVSDIPGDNPALVASGPTIFQPATAEKALEIASSSPASLPKRAVDLLKGSARSGQRPRPKRFGPWHLIATPAQSLAKAAAVAESAGVKAKILSDRICSDAEEAAVRHAMLARKAVGRKGRPEPPIVLISGGETTVRVPQQKGRGGRNTTFLLRLAVEMEGEDRFQAIAADTDGIDGTESNAGGFCDERTVAKLRRLGEDPMALLRRRCAYDAFEVLGDRFVTGPTGTNVNDFRAVLLG